jgi:hypothetical protein
LRGEHGRGHGERCRHHAAHHDLQTAGAGLGGERQGLGQAAGLVELDVDRVVATDEAVEVGACVQGLVGAKGHRARDVGQCGVGAGGQGLLDQLDASLGGGGHELRQQRGRPGLVGIGDEARTRAGGPDQPQAFGITRAAQLELQ